MTQALDHFRRGVRSWCELNVPRGWRQDLTGQGPDRYAEFQHWWFRRLREGGYVAPHIPQEYGGGGNSIDEQVVIHQELAQFDAPQLMLHVVALHNVPATLLHSGTEGQRRRHIPAVVEGETWCVGFSEPSAGSDLASLRTTAVRNGDRYVVNGQKIWTSFAQYADWCLLLARTNPSAPKHDGLSLLLLDLNSGGVDRRPIRQATGIAEFCETFLTDVEIPVENLVGQENDGWRVAQSMLSAERGLGTLEAAERLRLGVARLIDAAALVTGEDGESELDDPVTAQSLVSAFVESEVLVRLCKNMVGRLIQRGGVGPEASVAKVYHSEVHRRFMDTAGILMGLRGHLEKPLLYGGAYESGNWEMDYLNSFSLAIGGGTNEIQRTVIGEQWLRLPREPRP